VNCRKFTRSVLICALLLFVTVQRSPAIDNLRVAYPSMSTSVFALVIAQKEGYFKEEGLNVELLSIRGEIAIRTTLAGEVDFFTNAGGRGQKCSGQAYHGFSGQAQLGSDRSARD